MWLREIGRAGSAIREAIPAHPRFVDSAEAAFVSTLAERVGAQAWEARIVLRPNYQPQAIIWRRLVARYVPLQAFAAAL
jgi:hypothetical protein